MRTHLKPQSREERRQRRAASPPLPPSWERSLGPRRRRSPAGARGARGAQHPGSGIPGGVRTSARSASLGSAGPAGVCAPSPAPQRRFTPLPRARLRSPPPQRSATAGAPPARSAPLRTAQRCRGGAGSGGMLPGGGSSRASRAVPCRATRLRGGRGGPRVAPEEEGPGGCDPQLVPGEDSEPGARRGCPAWGEPPRSAPGPPRAPLPAQRPHVGAAPAPVEVAAPPLATAAPDRAGEICQQFATTLVITFLESAAIDVKIRELPRLSAWNNLFAANLFLFPALPNHIPPLRLPRLLPLGSPETYVTSRCASLLSGEAPAPFSPLCPHPSDPTFLSDPKNMQGSHCR